MRPGPGLVVMVLAFFTGARPTNTFSSRDYDRRLLPLSTLSQSSQQQQLAPPPSALPSHGTVTQAGASLERVRRTAEVPTAPADNDDDQQATIANRQHTYSPLRSDTGTATAAASSSSSSSSSAAVVVTGGHHRTRIRSPLPQPALFSDYFHYQHKPTPQPTQDTASRPQQPKLPLQEQYSLTDRGAPLVAASQLKVPDDDQGFSSGALARINPWLSACDLAQPNTAPDLQGQCTAGKLPVAWVDEGPGPPVCPESCGTIKEQSNYEKRFNLNVVNSPSMDNNSTISGDSHKTRDIRKTNKRSRGDMCDDIRNRKNQPGIHIDRSSSQLSSKGGDGGGRLVIGNDGSKLMATGAQTTDRQQQQLTSESEEEQKPKTIPCLDCLGDSKSTRPESICKSSNIKRDLQRLRLRHCCERDLYTALHGRALQEVLAGGTLCEKHLTDLMQTDALATRITCEFTEILVRYDCRQMYSIIHHCEDCKEAYRRWVCSTLIPFFDYVDRERQTHNKDTENSGGGPSTTTNVIKRSIPETLGSKMTIVDNSSDTKKRSRRKSNPEKIRTRIRPCLSVCQTVEQKCPYLLPGDRAPAHPTQYAGEPTFLCLDPNIPETGEQRIKSNHGPDNCCYDYCDTSSRKLCPRCQWNATALEARSELEAEGELDHTSPEGSNEIEVVATMDYYRDNSYPSETGQCTAILVPSNTGISTVRTSVLPNTRCPIPYYIGHLPDEDDLYHETSTGSARSAATRHRYHCQSLCVITTWLVALFLAVSHCELFSPRTLFCWLLLDSTPRQPSRPFLLLLTLLLESAALSPLQLQQFYRHHWLISWWWRWRSRATSTSVPFSSVTCCCCWRTQLFRRVIMQIRTLKCQLLLFWKLYLIRNYLRNRRRRRRDDDDRTPLIRSSANRAPPIISSQSQLRDTSSSRKCLERRRRHCTPSLLSSLGWGIRSNCCCCCGGLWTRGRGSNSNAKTVVRWWWWSWGTSRVVAWLGQMVRRKKNYFRITNWWSRGGGGREPFVGLLATNILIPWEVKFKFAIARIVCICEWVICGIEGSKFARGRLLRGEEGERMKKKTTTVHNIRYQRTTQSSSLLLVERSRRQRRPVLMESETERDRLGLITMIET